MIKVRHLSNKRISVLGIMLLFLMISPAVLGQSVELSIPASSGPIGEIVTIPVRIGDTTGREIISVEMTLQYPPQALSGQSVNTSGTLSEGWLAFSNEQTPGELVIIMASAYPLSGSGTLLNVDFLVKFTAQVGVSYPISFARAVLNDGTPAALTQDGSFTAETGSVVIYTMTSSAPGFGNGGGIEPPAGMNGAGGDVQVMQGDNQAFTMTPDTQYRIANVTVDGVSVPASEYPDGVYTFINVQQDHNISVTYRMEGDTNGDDRVNHLDLLRLILTYGKSSGEVGYDPEADLNQDGRIDVDDVLILWRSFGATK